VKWILQAAVAIGGLLPAGSALGCPYCAQDRGADIFLIAALALLPLLLAAGIWAQVKRIERSG
jgi:hypothetical protein